MGSLDDFVTYTEFLDWKQLPVTKRLMEVMRQEREEMKEGIIQNSFENEQEVKGRCKAIELLLNLEYEDLFADRKDINGNRDHS